MGERNGRVHGALVPLGIIFQTVDPDRLWKSEDEDTTHTAGGGFDLQILPRRLCFGSDYLYARSWGDTDILLGSARLGAGGLGGASP